MSTGYRTLKKVNAQELFDGRLEPYGVREQIVPDSTTTGKRCLTDGNNYMWAYIENDLVDCIERYASGGVPAKILGAIAEAFDTDIVSEHEPQFWGFETQEEWDAWMDQISNEDTESFYLEVLKYVRGESHDIGPTTVGMIRPQIAKEIVEKDPTLLLLENKDKLLSEIDRIYYHGEHTVTVTLSPEDIAAADLSVAHEDDVPRA